MRFDWTFDEAVKNASHLLAVGESRIIIRNEEPEWELITRVEAGCGIRSGIPTGMYLIGEAYGLEFHWDVDFEPRDANGRGQHLWDVAKLRDIAAKMRPEARLSFAGLLTEKVIPEMTKRTNEYREYLRLQEASEIGARALASFCASHQS